MLSSVVVKMIVCVYKAGEVDDSVQNVRTSCNCDVEQSTYQVAIFEGAVFMDMCVTTGRLVPAGRGQERGLLLVRPNSAARSRIF